MAMHFYGKFFADFVFHETDGVCDYGELDAATANRKLYASWSDAHRVFFSTSSDQGSHWSTVSRQSWRGGWAPEPGLREIILFHAATRARGDHSESGRRPRPTLRPALGRARGKISEKVP
jgi:hypothetical protein